MDSLENKKNRALKMMLWFGIGSLIMTFAGLTSAFLVSKNRDDWVEDFNLIMSELMSDSRKCILNINELITYLTIISLESNIVNSIFNRFPGICG